MKTNSKQQTQNLFLIYFRCYIFEILFLASTAGDQTDAETEGGAETEAEDKLPDVNCFTTKHMEKSYFFTISFFEN